MGLEWLTSRTYLVGPCQGQGLTQQYRVGSCKLAMGASTSHL